MKTIKKSKTSIEKPRDRPFTMLRIRAAAGNRQRGWLTASGLILPVALGRGGILANKVEGDGGTPLGTFRARQVWFRADRMSRPATHLPVRAIAADDAWCEDPSDRRYNRPMRWDGTGDRLVRVDHLYDIIIEIDHNTVPRAANRGSAVFLHLARDGLEPTAGCVAMSRRSLLRLLARLDPKTRILIG